MRKTGWIFVPSCNWQWVGIRAFYCKKDFFFFLLNLHQYGPLTFCFPPPFQNLKRIKTTSIPPLDPLRPLGYVYTLRKLCNYTILHGNRSFLGFSIKYLFLHFMVIRIGEMKFSRASKNSAIEYISTRIDIILYILHTSCMKNINTPARDRTKSHLRIFFHLRFDFVARVKSNFFFPLVIREYNIVTLREIRKKKKVNIFRNARTIIQYTNIQ